ncbi:glycosyltransferase [Paenibacillus sp. 598K]|uniref:glycosyltransferase n=1 Tax=Paenibacillus sp. 598K TaxID=1117987 RepID=UPI000FFEC40E|nr:glycosyltransferase [Paenibacillus sp. 598K]
MKVSVLTVYYNRGDQVDESIRSLLSQTYEDLEIIVVDDGSTDDTLARLQQWSDPRLRVISHSNRGFTRSIIEAVAASSGEWIAIHGSGDISYPERIEEQAALLAAQPEVGVVGCIVENRNIVTGETAIFHKLREGEPALAQLLRHNVYTHGEVMFRRSVYEQAGGYREIFKFTQDYDLWLRMALITEFASVDRLLYRRYTLPDGVSASVDKMMVQQYLAELGRQCVELRVATGRDLIDRHGAHGLFFRKRSKRLSGVLQGLAKAAIVQDRDLAKADQLLQLALEEHRSLKGWLLRMAVRFADRRAGRRERALRLIDRLRALKARRRGARALEAAP